MYYIWSLKIATSILEFLILDIQACIYDKKLQNLWNKYRKEKVLKMAAAEAVILHMNEPEPDSGTQLEGSENASSGSNEENNGETSPVAHTLNTNYDSSDGAIPVSLI